MCAPVDGDVREFGLGLVDWIHGGRSKEHLVSRRRRVGCGVVRRADPERGAGGPTALDRGDAAPRAQRQPLRLDPGRGDGLESREGRPGRLSDREHPGRTAGQRRDPAGPGVPHGALGDRPAGGGRGRRIPGPGSPSLCGLLQRPLRRPEPGDGGDDGQPPLPQRRRRGPAAAGEIPPDPPGGSGDRDLRQGVAGRAHGAGGLCRVAGGHRPRRRHPPPHQRGGCGHGADHRRPFRPRTHQPPGRRGHGVPGLRLARRRLPVSGDRGHGAGRGGRTGDGPASHGPESFGSAGLDGRGPAVGPGAHPPQGTEPAPVPDSDAGGPGEWNAGPCGVRGLHQPVAPYTGHRPRRRTEATPGRGLEPGQSKHAPPRGRPAQRASQPSHHPGLPGRRRAGSDAPPSGPGPPEPGGADGDGGKAGGRAGLVAGKPAPPGLPPRAAAVRRGGRGPDHHGLRRRPAGTDSPAPSSFLPGTWPPRVR